MVKKIIVLLSTSLFILAFIVKNVYAESKYNKELITGSPEEISLQLNQRAFKSAKEAILINEDAIIDAISVTPLSYIKEAPIITSKLKVINKDTLDYIDQAGISKITIIGSEKSISKNVENQLLDKNIEVERFYGKDRFDTALKIAKEIDKVKDIKDVVLLSSNIDIKSAISIYSYAAKNNMPIVWISDKYLDIISKYLNNQEVNKVYCVNNSQQFETMLIEKINNIEFIEKISKSSGNIDIIKKFNYKNKSRKVYVVNTEFGQLINQNNYVSLGSVAAKSDIPVLISGQTLTKVQNKYLKSTNVNEIIQVANEVEEYSFIKFITGKEFLSRISLIIILLIMCIRVFVINNRKEI